MEVPDSINNSHFSTTEGQLNFKGELNFEEGV